jgi:replication factor C large subunit
MKVMIGSSRIATTGNGTIWVDKYAPRIASEILGNNDAVSKVMKWLSIWTSGKIPEKRAILLFGPTGTGKTSLVYAIASESGYEVVEINASDKRDKETLRRLIGSSASLGSLFSEIKGRILLIDEVDGLSGDEDRGGVSAIIETIKETRNPIILTANDKWDSKIRSLHSHCLSIETRKIIASTIVNALSKICQKEGIQSNVEALKIIADHSNGDLRSAINDLQAFAEGKREISAEDIKGLSARRDRVKGIFDGLREMFQADTFSKALYSIESLDMDHDMLIQWVYENIPREFTNPSELSQAFDTLSRADVFLGRIKRTQDWGLLSYVYELMSGGVALARTTSPRRFVSYSFPNYIRGLSATRAKRTALKEVCLKIGSKTHASTREILHEYLPTARTIMENNAKMAGRMIKWFDLTEEDMDAITGGKKIKVAKEKKARTPDHDKTKSKEKPMQAKQTLLF